MNDPVPSPANLSADKGMPGGAGLTNEAYFLRHPPECSTITPTDKKKKESGNMGLHRMRQSLPTGCQAITGGA